MMDSKSFVFRFGDVEVREREFTLTRAGEVLPVQPKIFSVLLFLVHNPQRLITKEELLNAVWGDTAVTESSLTRIIALLRQLLGDDIGEQRYIATVAKIGYRFVCPVEVSEDAPGIPASADSANSGNGSAGEALPARSQGDGIRTFRRRWLLSAAVLALSLALFVWYLHHPLPPPRITGYTQITHDGHKKILAGADGTRLYFTQTGSNSIAQIAISGGEISPVPISVPDPELLDVSPNGSSFLVKSLNANWGLGPLWNVRILGGSVRRLGEAYSAAFSADGNSVAYSTANANGKTWGEIYLAHSDGTGVRKLASVGDDVGYIAWSPDGAVIRFSTLSDERIWEVASNGSNLHELLPGWRHSSSRCCGRWTPDGKFFLFLSWEPVIGGYATYAGDGGDIWALDERRGPSQKPKGPVQLTTGPIRWGAPFPSKDGGKIFSQVSTHHGELTRFDSKTKLFLPFLGGISAQGVVFSNDGKSIAYVTYPEGTLWKANRDGSSPVQLTDPPMQAFLPRWSPDGTQISFLGSSPGNAADGIFIVSSDGGILQRLLPEKSGLPTWSPNGRKIVFNPAAADGNTICRILDLDSHQVTTVPGSNDMGTPLWSPDGRYLAAGHGDGSHLMVFDFNTQQWSELAQKGPADSPQWSRDGQFIYFKRASGDRGVFRISVKGGPTEKIADLNDWHDAGWWGMWMGLDSTDAPLLLRDAASYDIYALTLSQE